MALAYLRRHAFKSMGLELASFETVYFERDNQNQGKSLDRFLFD
jgi:hypothetical protein